MKRSFSGGWRRLALAGNPAARPFARLAVAALVAFGAGWSEISAAAQPIETAAEYVHMVDVGTGTVLLSRRADAPVPPAAMAKLMTLAIAFDAIAEGQADLDDEFPISEYTWRTGGAPSRTATMFASINSRVRLADLLRGVMVQAGNDACIAIAEGLAGSEAAFVAMMNQRAAAMGMTGSHFTNATGLPEPDGQRTTMRDLTLLLRYLIEEHGELHRIFAEPEFTWNGIRQLNRNPLIGSPTGVDGGFAGFSEGTGYGLTVSSLADGQRIVLAMHGLRTASARLSEARRLLSWAANSFETLALFEAGEPVGEIPVYGGAPGRVELASERPVRVLLPRGTRANLRARIVYQGPLMAPVTVGQPVGTLRLSSDDVVISEMPLTARTSAEVGPLHARAMDAAVELVVGLVRSGLSAATSR